MAIGSGRPDEFAPMLCVQNAPLSKNGESLALASIQNTVASPLVANRMRRLFGLFGNAARQDVLLAAYLDAVSEEGDFAPWAAYRKAKKKERGEGK